MALLLIQLGAHIYSEDNEGGTPLFEAAGRGHAELVRLLLKHGADTSAQYMDGATPLHYASVMPPFSALYPPFSTLSQTFFTLSPPFSTLSPP